MGEGLKRAVAAVHGVSVGQVYEDFVPPYTDSHGDYTCGKRQLKVVALDTKQDRRWDAKAGKYPALCSKHTFRSLPYLTLLA